MSYLCNQLDNSFRKLLPNIESFAVGVSGGADSLFCVFAAHEWAHKNNINIIAVTVDHGVRPESTQEAMFVSDLMKNHGIAHHTLTWTDPQPLSTQESARNARYSLLSTFCDKHDIHHLLTGHHALDQAETILMRIARQSHLRGLRGMEASQRIATDLTLVRPMLEFWPTEIKHRLRQNNINWIEDPSNTNDKYLRTHLRRSLTSSDSELDRIGLSPKSLINWSQKISQSYDFIDTCVRQFLMCTEKNDRETTIPITDFLELHDELQRHVLEALIRTHSVNTKHPPRWESILNLQERLKNKQTGTLGGLKFQPKDNHIVISHEKYSP